MTSVPRGRYNLRVRRGAFGEVLERWAERPCVLTLRVVATGAELRTVGVLRAYHSLRSLHGWALVPPQQHGGFGAIRLTELPFADAVREVVGDGPETRLRFSLGEASFELERDRMPFTAPPRRVRAGRYLYVGGRRRVRPEGWML